MLKYSGEFRSAEFNECKLNWKQPTFVPIVFHNLSNYIAPLFIEKSGDVTSTLKLIPSNEEKHISFSKCLPNGLELRILDSYRFLAYSLETLSSNSKDKQLRETKKYFSKGIFFF